MTEPEQFEGVDALILALGAGKPMAEAARAAGMSARTGYRHLEDETVRQRIRETRAAMVDRAVGQLAEATTAAVTTLVTSLDAQNEAVRVRAALGLLDQAVRLREASKLERRVAELEAALAEQGTHRGAA